MKPLSKPFLVAIAGGSCSGKTTIANCLQHDLSPTTVVIAEDDYYRCSSTIANFDAAGCNFDEPASKDHALLLAHLKAARDGQAFNKPLYDFATHRRKPETERVQPRDFVIVEGMHLLVTEDLRAVFDLTVFMETDEPTRKSRRLVRDVSERERTADFALDQFSNHVQPMHDLHVAPQVRYADLVLHHDRKVFAADETKPILARIFKLED